MVGWAPGQTVPGPGGPQPQAMQPPPTQPPPMAPPGVAFQQGPVAQPGSVAAGPSTRIRNTARELGEVLAIVLLVATTLRVLVAIVAAIVNVTGYSAGPSLSESQIVSAGFSWGAGFGDVGGALLIVAIVGLLWWLAITWTTRLQWAGATIAQDPGRQQWVAPWLVNALAHVRRTRRYLVWGALLAAFTALASLAFIVTVALGQENQGAHVQWEHYVGTGGFQVAYALVSMGAFLVLRRLASSCAGLERAAEALVPRAAGPRTMTAPVTQAAVHVPQTPGPQTSGPQMPGPQMPGPRPPPTGGLGWGGPPQWPPDEPGG